MVQAQKTVYLLEHRGRLANQLWNLVAVAAYCEERGHALADCASFDYHASFAIPAAPRGVEGCLGLWDRAAPALSRPPFSLRGVRSLVQRSADAAQRASGLLARVPEGAAELATYDRVFYLPPSDVTFADHRAVLDRLDRADDGAAIVVRGWPFKNPIGIARHRDRVLARLRPRPRLGDAVRSFVEARRKRAPALVGVHIRQGDYLTWLDGKLAITAREARSHLDELLRRRGIAPRDAAIVVCSDGPLDMRAFAGLDAVEGPGSAVADLLVLAACDVILGSNSTFGGFASYYGDVPFVVMQRSGIDWDHYRDRRGFFEDPYFIFNLVRGSREGGEGERDGSYFERA